MIFLFFFVVITYLGGINSSNKTIIQLSAFFEGFRTFVNENLHREVGHLKDFGPINARRGQPHDLGYLDVPDRKWMDQ